MACVGTDWRDAVGNNIQLTFGSIEIEHLSRQGCSINILNREKDAVVSCYHL